MPGLVRFFSFADSRIGQVPAAAEKAVPGHSAGLPASRRSRRD